MWDVGNAEFVKNVKHRSFFFPRSWERQAGRAPTTTFGNKSTIDSLTKVRSISIVDFIYPISLPKSMKLFLFHVSFYFSNVAHIQPSLYETVFSTISMPNLSLSSLIKGAQIFMSMGAKMPLSLIVPFNTCCTATAQGRPTSLAMAM